MGLEIPGGSVKNSETVSETLVRTMMITTTCLRLSLSISHSLPVWRQRHCVEPQSYDAYSALSRDGI